MTIRETFNRFISRIFGKKDYPVHGTCSECGEQVYLPFRCHYCGKYFCGTHHLPFNHDCPNIGEWKNSGKNGKKK